MKTPDLREVRTRLEEAVQLIPGEPVNKQDEFEAYESVAIAILDSEHSDFPPGVLQEYLMSLLYLRQLELNLIPFPDPQEA
ncbi:hypothetical protein FV139_17695 [Parahaliea maris]|uniref:Uncharacterized protein n=1 Tax=Parahaliea maris TaxID=2716870 RepID=A0A5C8ZTM1_9GAMM|nr:hypothetical protein [Parahaliea maris]TXS90807.1 hypothetical protein FV139_17695 [Parahaliea maris]